MAVTSAYRRANLLQQALPPLARPMGWVLGACNAVMHGAQWRSMLSQNQAYFFHLMQIFVAHTVQPLHEAQPACLAWRTCATPKVDLGPSIATSTLLCDAVCMQGPSEKASPSHSSVVGLLALVPTWPGWAAGQPHPTLPICQVIPVPVMLVTMSSLAGHMQAALV